MRGIKLVFLVAVAIAGLTLSTGVGAATGKQTVPSAPTHVRNVVIKGGADSTGRIPARLTRLLKTATSNPYCPGATVSTTPAGTQSCVWPADYTGQVTCLQTSNSATVVQTCDASQIQTIPNRNNTAVILQVIISQNPPSPQDGTQVVKLRQTALGTGSNTAGIAQYVKQSLGPGTPEGHRRGRLGAGRTGHDDCITEARKPPDSSSQADLGARQQQRAGRAVPASARTESSRRHDESGSKH